MTTFDFNEEGAVSPPDESILTAILACIRKHPTGEDDLSRECQISRSDLKPYIQELLRRDYIYLFAGSYVVTELVPVPAGPRDLTVPLTDAEVRQALPRTLIDLADYLSCSTSEIRAALDRLKTAGLAKKSLSEGGLWFGTNPPKLPPDSDPFGDDIHPVVTPEPTPDPDDLDTDPDEEDPIPVVDYSSTNTGAIVPVLPIRTARDTGAIMQILPLESIHPSPLNPRKEFEESGLAELAASIGQHGLIEPLVVRHAAGPGWETPYELIAGERRFRACQRLNLSHVAVMIREADDNQVVELALVENLQRRDISPLEEAAGFRALQERGYTQKQIGEKVHRSQPAIANAMRLLELPASVQEQIRAGALSPSHGIALCRWKNFPAVVSALAEKVVQESLPVKLLEGEETQILSRLIHSHPDALAPLFRAPFEWTSICKSCPFDAYRSPAENWGQHLCLNPTHYAELREEAERREIEVAQAAEEKLIAERPELAEKGLPRLSDLAGKYETIGTLKWEQVDGCSEACPCRVEALGQNGSLVPVCTDPKRRAQLRSKQSRVERKTAKTTFEQTIRQAKLNLAQDHPAMLARMAAVTLKDLAMSAYASDSAAQFCASEGIPCPALEARIPERGYHESGLANLHNLSQSPVRDLLRFHVLRELKREADQFASDRESRSALAEFLGAPLPELPEEQPELVPVAPPLTTAPSDSYTEAGLRQAKNELKDQLLARDRAIAGLEAQIEHMRAAAQRRRAPCPPSPAWTAEQEAMFSNLTRWLRGMLSGPVHEESLEPGASALASVLIQPETAALWLSMLNGMTGTQPAGDDL
jgi:ParB/RepB/Spo0J family partition protein